MLPLLLVAHAAGMLVERHASFSMTRRCACAAALGAPALAAAIAVPAASADEESSVAAALAAMDARKARPSAEDPGLPNLNPFDMQRYRQSDAYKKGEAKVAELESKTITEKLGSGIGAVRKEGLLASTGKEVPWFLPPTIAAGVAAVVFFERGSSSSAPSAAPSVAMPWMAAEPEPAPAAQEVVDGGTSPPADASESDA